MFGHDRNSLRRYYLTVWKKTEAGLPLEPLEHLIADVIRQHPEYHALLESTEAILDRDYLPEMGQTNPFLHMGMHIALQEQLGSDRPHGIRNVYQKICRRAGDTHTAEHLMMECLGETLWEAQRSGSEPDERLYLQRLRKLLGRL